MEIGWIGDLVGLDWIFGWVGHLAVFYIFGVYHLVGLPICFGWVRMEIWLSWAGRYWYFGDLVLLGIWLGWRFCWVGDLFGLKIFVEFGWAGLEICLVFRFFLWLEI